MMKRIIKKGLFALVLMLGLTFAAPQQMMAGKNPFGDRGWICAGTQEFNITLFEDGTIWIVFYNGDGTKEVGIYDPDSGMWYSNHWTSGH